MTSIACLTVSGPRVPLPLLERLTVAADDTAAVRLFLEAAGAQQLFVLSTCERVELYAAWQGPARPDALEEALAGVRKVPVAELAPVAAIHEGSAAVWHLFRVASGLESFVLGETDIVAQVRAAAAAARATGVTRLELDRLLAAAVNTSRRVHRATGFGESAKSLADAAVDAVAAHLGHGAASDDLAGRRVLVVGAGTIAGAVVVRAGRLSARVTVCNRTVRHANRFRAGGAAVVPLDRLAECLRQADAVVVGTASATPLVDAAMIRGAMRVRDRELLVVDACLPRNVDPDVRTMTGVRLLDLSDLRPWGREATDALHRDTRIAASIVETEVARFERWTASRSVTPLLQPLRHSVAR